MKRLASAFALLALLALPVQAIAKGPTKATVCGPEGCKSLGDVHGITGLANGYGGQIGEMPAPAPYYELQFTSVGGGEQHTWSTWYVPSRKMFASVDEREGVYWMPLDQPKFAALIADVKPFPKPEITAVTIGSRRVTENPASYLRLFTVLSTDENAYPLGVADWEPVTFVSKQRSPWTLTQSGIQFSPSNGMLGRGIELLKLPDQMAADLRGGEPLAETSSGFAWRNVVLAMVGALALLIAIGFIRPLRRRVIVRRAPTTA